MNHIGGGDNNVLNVVTESSPQDYYKIRDLGCVKNAKVFGLSDSIKRAKYAMSTDTDKCTEELTKGIKSLAMSDKGEGHDGWLKGVNVQFDLTFTIKAWTEGERYHWLDIVTSQSTMHRITKFDLDKAYIKYVDPRVIEVMKEKVKEYNALPNDDPNKAEKYLGILYSNPTGLKLTAGMTTNYLQLKTIYAQRKTHRLPEWRAFCEWIESLPYSELITGDK